MLVTSRQQRQILFVNLSLNPDGREISHVVQRRAFLNVLPFFDVLRDDMPAQAESEFAHGVSALPMSEIHRSVCRQCPEASSADAQLSMNSLSTAPFGIDQVLDRNHQIGTVERCQIVTVFDHLPGLVGKQLVDSASAAGGDSFLSMLIELDVANGVDVFGRGTYSTGQV